MLAFVLLALAGCRSVAPAAQRFEGSYTLRRVVDGATPAQRRWHLHDASLAPGRGVE